MKLCKLKVRGKNNTKREIGLLCIAYNFNKYLAKLSRKKAKSSITSIKNCLTMKSKNNGFALNSSKSQNGSQNIIKF